MGVAAKSNLAVKAGFYTDRDGNEKARFERIGELVELDDGRRFITLKPFINLSALPLDDDGRLIVSVFDGEQAQGGGQAQPPAQRSAPPAQTQQRRAPAGGQRRAAGGGQRQAAAQQTVPDDDIPF